jgi:hypothetical protein
MPLIIRPAGEFFHYVGPAFVSGVIYGEAWHKEGVPDAPPFECPSKSLDLEKAQTFWLV